MTTINWNTFKCRCSGIHKHRIIEEDGRYYVEVNGWLTLWFWERLRRFGGSFGNEDISFDSIEEAKNHIFENKKSVIVWEQ